MDCRLYFDHGGEVWPETFNSMGDCRDGTGHLTGGVGSYSGGKGFVRYKRSLVGLEKGCYET